MWWKHREFDSTADECIAESNEQKARDYSANSAAKCTKHWKRNQLKANNEKDANLADEAEFTNDARQANEAKICIKVNICTKDSSISRCKH